MTSTMFRVSFVGFGIRSKNKLEVFDAITSERFGGRQGIIDSNPVDASIKKITLND